MKRPLGVVVRDRTLGEVWTLFAVKEIVRGHTIGEVLNRTTGVADKGGIVQLYAIGSRQLNRGGIVSYIW